MAVINTNVKALFSQMALGSSGRAQSVAMQQLSTGKRINSARDDAAGMAIATRMTQQIRSLNQAVRNAGDAISLIQTAEGATNEITDMMQRMRELAIQAVNDTNNNDQRSYLDLEFQQLKQQIVQIAGQTEWNGFPVLDGSAGERVGEMPVYKMTSNNQFGSVFINPTTTRTVGGKDGGQQQELTIAVSSATADGTTSITVDAGALGKIQVPITKEEADGGADVVAAKMASYLNSTPVFGANSGRKVEVDAIVDYKLIFTFNPADGDVPKVHVDGGASIVSDADAEITREATTSASEVFKGNGKFLKSGAMRLNIDTDNKVTASFLSTDNQIFSMTGSLDASSGKVTFEVDTGLNASVISDTLNYTLFDAKGDNLALVGTGKRNVSLNVDVAGSIPTMRAGDLIINGVTIGPSNASDDKLSPANNAAGSAIAKAAAINRMAVDQGFSQGESQSITFASNLILPGTITVGGVNVSIGPDDNSPVLVAKKVALALKSSPQFEPSTGRSITWAEGSTAVNINYPVTDGDVKPIEVSPGNTALVSTVRTVQNYAPNVPGTGVFAKVNENILTGQAMKGSSVVTGSVFINGYASADIASVLNNPRATREATVKAINLISDRTGVKAVDTGSDEKGITLTAADGRNIEVRFETPNNAADFGQRIGLREGVQSATISLESKIDAPVVLSSSSIGDIARVGMEAGNYSKNRAVMNTQQRDPVQPAVAQVSTVKLTGTGSLATGESAIVVLNGVQFTVNATADMTAKEVRADLLEQLTTGPDASKTGVIATAGASSEEIQLTAKTPGLAYTLSANKLPTTSTSAIGITAKEVIPNASAQVKSLGLNDLQINGINIRAATLQDDKYSTRDVTSSDPASSAIALAASINASTSETGVRAEPNPVTIVGGPAVTKLPAGDIEGKSKQSLWINGVEIKVDFVANESAKSRSDKVVDAINAYSGPSGVKAVSNGNGVTLNSDGRNVAVWFDSSVKDLSAASFGLDKGGAVAQVSKITMGGDATAEATGTVVINGVTVTGTQASGKLTPEDMAEAMMKAINEKVADPNSPLKNVIAEVSADGNSLLVRSTVPGSAFDIRGADFDADGANLTMDIGTITANSNGNNDVNAIDLSDAYKDYVLGGVSNAANVKTLYGTVKLIAAAPNLPTMPGVDGLKPNAIGASGRPIVVSTGGDGLGDLSNFSALGFNEGVFGGRASTEMEPPRVGRMAFQVGSSANQIITIDLADFGKNGAITGEITGDVDRDVETRSVRINSKDGATAVLNLLDRAMDRVNATRATMGAVMNRLDHVINNLTNVSMNMSASRSQIEDADYASASTELAKTQIMQQAATAVLAQANTSQQSVLKLLGG